MSDGGQASLEGLLHDHFGVLDFPSDAPPLVPLASHRGVAAALRERGYLIYGFVVASHWPAIPAKKGAEAGEPEHYEVATALRTIGPRSHLAIWRLRVLPDETVESLVDLFPGADWQEREQYDLVGVRFAHHPDLRRLMMPDDWEGHPLRRDYAIDTHCLPWR